MKYIITLIAFAFLFARCAGPDVEVYPTGSYDTLGIRWMTMERNNIIYYFQGTGEKGASIYTDMHEDAYTTLSQVFKPQLPQKLRFFVWTEPRLAPQLLNRQLGYAVPDQCVCHVASNQTLGHEITHILSYWAGGTLPNSYSKFVDEGVAVAFDLSGRDKLANAKAALAGQNVGSVAELWAGNLQDAPDDILYPVGGAFMEFIYKKNLPDQFNALIKNQEMEDAENIYGKEQLHAWIDEFDGLMGL